MKIQERKTIYLPPEGYGMTKEECLRKMHEDIGFNKAIDEVERLNKSLLGQ